MELNWNYLTSFTLVHSQKEVYSPWEVLYNVSEGAFYTHSIKDDFETYILNEFMGRNETTKKNSENFT